MPIPLTQKSDKMKTTPLIILLFLFGLMLISSCVKEDPDITMHEWEFKTIHPPDGNRKGNGKKYILTFSNPVSYHYNTDKNDCSGAYFFGMANDIGFDPPVCTEVCCDSEFAQMIALYLPQVTYYEIRGRNLNLKGPNVQIDLRRR